MCAWTKRLCRGLAVGGSHHRHLLGVCLSDISQSNEKGVVALDATSLTTYCTVAGLCALPAHVFFPRSRQNFNRKSNGRFNSSLALNPAKLHPSLLLMLLQHDAPPQSTTTPTPNFSCDKVEGSNGPYRQKREEDQYIKYVGAIL